jgi:hypothetical protein
VARVIQYQFLPGLRERVDLRSSRSMDVKKFAALSVGAIGFAILVIALDFAVFRAACLSPTPQERVTTMAWRGCS